LLGCAACCGLLATSPTLRAQGDQIAAAEALFVQGRQAMAEARYDVACEAFAESNRLDPAVGTMFNLALCERKRGRIASSWAMYRSVLEKLPPRDPRVAVARQAADELEARLPKLTVNVAEGVPEGAKVFRDEFELTDAMRGLPLPVDPGSYVLVLQIPGHADRKVNVSLAEGETKSITLEAGPESPTPAAAPPTNAPAPPPAAARGDAAAKASTAETASSGPAMPSTDGANTPGDAAPGDLAPEELPQRELNLSLMYPVATRDSDKYRVKFELGLIYSRIGALDGLGVTLGVLHTWHARGVMLAGGLSFVEGRTEGVALSYMLNISTGGLNGVRLAGLGNAQLPKSDGEIPGKSKGVQIASVGNVMVGDLEGAQIAAVANLSVGHMRGPQIAAVANFVSGRLEGPEIAALNNTACSVEGIQLGLTNVVLQSLQGMQLGLINISNEVDGLQLGLINVAKEVDGASIGVLPFTLDGGVQPTAWFSTAYAANFGLRFVGGAVTTTWSAAVNSADGEADLSPGISLGIPIRIGNLVIEPDAGYRADLDDNGRFVRHRLPYRASIGWRFFDTLRVYAGAGAIVSYDEANDGAEVTAESEPLGFVGVTVFD
jgi:hypothetical protein